MISADDSAKTAPALHRARVYLLYHEMHPAGSEYSYAIDTTRFREHLEVFARLRDEDASGYWPEITFDDGHLSNYEYARPLLEEQQLKATFFITAGWTGQKKGYMGWEEIRAMQRAGHAIGAHGWTHKLLTHCNHEELQSELRRPKLALEDRLGVPVTKLSLPGGRANARVLRACEENGYEQVYTSEPKAEHNACASMIGRLNVHGSRSAEWMEGALHPKSGLLGRLRREYRVKAAAQTVLGDGLYGKVWALLNRQGSKTDEAQADGR